MAKQYTRQEFLSRLRAEIARGKPLVMTGAGNGIAAKFIERGGVDILGVYNTGYFRMQGYGSLAGMLPMADANEMVYNMGRREVLPQVQEVPVIAGLNGVDVLRDMKLFLEDCKRIGFSGVHNFPTVAWFDGDFRKTLEATGLGYQHEINMLNHARELDMLTIGYAFNETDAEFLMQYAMPDIFIYHAGITRGGSTGYDASQSLQDMAARSQAHYDLAKRFKPDVILLAHGAGLVNPDDAQYMLDHTNCHGIQLGSSIERLAIEEPLQARAASFKQTSFRKDSRVTNEIYIVNFIRYTPFIMCRSIKQLRFAGAEPTEQELYEASLQFVRKVSGYRKPSQRNQEAFDLAVQEIAASTRKMLNNIVSLPAPARAATELKEEHPHTHTHEHPNRHDHAHPRRNVARNSKSEYQN